MQSRQQTRIIRKIIVRRGECVVVFFGYTLNNLLVDHIAGYYYSQSATVEVRRFRAIYF